MQDRRSILRHESAAWLSLHRIFPERQIMVRNGGRIRCFRLGTLTQLAVVATVAGGVLWSLLATAAYFDGLASLTTKDDEIAQRTAELDGVKANYRAAFGQLDEFQTVFQGITCEISDIQDSLLKIAERGVGNGKKGGATAGMPKLDPDAVGCRQGDRAVAAASQAPAIVGKADAAQEQEILRQRLTRLQDELGKLKASHGAFLQESAGLAAVRIGELERALSAAGVDLKTIQPGKAKPRTEDAKWSFFGRGGPFVAAHGGAAPPNPDINPVTLFNSHADRLDNLASTIRSLPLGEPLVDYEVTSPFGARNDPINAMSGIHEGVDMGAITGTPVTATGDGQVVWATWRDRYGLLVEVDHGMGVHTRYAHLSKVLVNLGQHVSRGTPLGLVGETGRTTGPHLHYEVRVGEQATNPMKFIMAGQNVLKGQ